MRHCLLLDLKDDAASIEQYEAHHRAIPPAVTLVLRSQGVTDMQIYRLGTRLCMVMESDDSVFDAERMARAAATDPVLTAWEDLMWRYQAPTPWTPAGAKWVSAKLIFDLATQR